MKISLCMIVRNEAPVLARCLESACDLFDETVVADTGSTDNTIKIARAYGAKVFSFPWGDDFAAARNFAFSRGTGDYLAWLDADDVIPPGSRARFPALREFLERDAPDLLFCPYRAGDLRYYRERFLRREAGFSWEGRVHECVPPHGNCARFDFEVRHLPGGEAHGARNLRIYEKWAKEEKLAGRDLFYYGRELYYGGRYPEAREKLGEMLAGEGWYVNKIEACRFLALCLQKTGDAQAARAALIRSFCFGEPRAAVLCDLGNIDMGAENYTEAAFWYQAALLCRDHADEGDFDDPTLRGVVPLLQLVVCFWRLGDKEKAKAFHLRAKELAPSHPAVLFNEGFFSQ